MQSDPIAFAILEQALTRALAHRTLANAVTELSSAIAERAMGIACLELAQWIAKNTPVDDDEALQLFLKLGL